MADTFRYRRIAKTSRGQDDAARTKALTPTGVPAPRPTLSPILPPFIRSRRARARPPRLMRMGWAVCPKKCSRSCETGRDPSDGWGLMGVSPSYVTPLLLRSRASFGPIGYVVDSQDLGRVDLAINERDHTGGVGKALGHAEKGLLVVRSRLFVS